MDSGNIVHQETRGNSKREDAGILRGNTSVHLSRDGKDQKILLPVMHDDVRTYGILSHIAVIADTADGQRHQRSPRSGFGHGRFHIECRDEAGAPVSFR